MSPQRSWKKTSARQDRRRVVKTRTRFALALEQCEERTLLSGTGFLQGVVFQDVSGSGQLGGVNTPIAGATVTLTDSSNNQASTQTDANGAYIFDNITPGKYTLTESALGFTNETTQINSPLTQIIGTPTAGSITVQVPDSTQLQVNFLPSDFLASTNPHSFENVYYNGNPVNDILGALPITVTNLANSYTSLKFNAYCGGITQSLDPSNPNHFVVNATPGVDIAALNANGHAGRIGYLIDNFSNGPDNIALQLAIWKLEYDTDATLGNFTGGVVTVQSPTDAYVVTDAENFIAESAGKSEPVVLLNATGLNAAGGPAPGFQSMFVPGELNFADVGSSPLVKGETATIGFWHNKNGQALINGLNGGPTATNLATWLTTNFPSLYGAGGVNPLPGGTNADVASLFLTDFSVHGPKVDAQILGAALAAYVTDSNLAGGTNAASYGFIVNNFGTGSSTFVISSSEFAAFGISSTASSVSVPILTLLYDVNAQASHGLFYANTGVYNTVFDGINQGGDI